MTNGRPSLRAGVVGSGFMAEVHAAAIRSSGGTVAGATGSTPARAEHAAEVTGASIAYESPAELFAADLDVVHICTPNATHEELALDAIAAGKHVVVEKPIGVNAHSARRIAAAAAAAGVGGAVPFIYRFHPMVREMRERVASGQLGHASVIQGSYLQDWLAAADDTNWRVISASGGASRAFADIGSHLGDLIEFVTGDPIARLSARTRAVFPVRAGIEVDTEDVASVQFETVAGVLGTLLVSQVSAGRKNRLMIEVSGSEHSFAFDQESPDVLWVGNRFAGSLIARDAGRLFADAARLSRVPAGHPQGYQEAFTNFVEDAHASFVGLLRAGVPDLDAGVRAAEICDAVMWSAGRNGAWLDLAPRFASAGR